MIMDAEKNSPISIRNCMTERLMEGVISTSFVSSIPRRPYAAAMGMSMINPSSQTGSRTINGQTWPPYTAPPMTASE